MNTTIIKDIQKERQGFILDDKPVKEATRYNLGKPEISMVPSSVITGIAKVLGFGATKYDRNNWKKGMKYTSVYDSIQRHLMKWKDGESLDNESDLSHLYHAACNIAFLIEYEEKGLGTDDRRD